MEIRIGKIQEMCFYLIFSFLVFKVVDKGTMNLFKGSEDSGFRILSGYIEKYKPALSELDSSWDNSYCLRLLIVLLDADVGRLQFLVSEDSFFCCIFSDF